MEDHNLLFDAFLFLAAAIIMVPIAMRIGLGTVIGYLLAGVLIGPWGFGLISDVESIMHFAEFGVVLLLFLIGLELEPKRLWKMRRPIVGIGGGQVLLSAIAIFAITILLGLDYRTALVAALGLALSSTAIALQTLTEKNLISTPAGNTGFSVLLFQDIAVIPMLAIIPLLGVGVQIDSGESPILATLKVIGAILFIVIGGRYATRPIFHAIANSRSREIFTAFSLALVIGIALLMQTVNLSMALGTFLAGVLLAESEYRHQLESDIEPFKGLLLGLFFISVGMSINFGLLLESPLIILGLVALLIAVKAIVLLFLTRFTAIKLGQKTFFAFLLSQGGEFAFVIFSLATSFSVISTEVSNYLTVVVALSMATTPILLLIHEKYIEPKFETLDKTMEVDVENEGNPVVIAGFGRVGQITARLLHANKIGTTIIDHNPNQIERVRQFGFKVFYGDLSRLDILHSAGLADAKLFILAIDNKEIGLKAIDYVKEHFPHVKIIVRAWDLLHIYELRDRGINLFERETFDSSLRLGVMALKELGMPAHKAHRASQSFRQYDLALLERMYAVHKDQEKLIDLSREASQEIERLFEADEKAIEKAKAKDWD